MFAAPRAFGISRDSSGHLKWFNPPESRHRMAWDLPQEIPHGDRVCINCANGATRPSPSSTANTGNRRHAGCRDTCRMNHQAFHGAASALSSDEKDNWVWEFAPTSASATRRAVLGLHASQRSRTLFPRPHQENGNRSDGSLRGVMECHGGSPGFAPFSWSGTTPRRPDSRAARGRRRLRSMSPPRCWS